MAKKLVKTVYKEVEHGKMMLKFYEDTDDTLLPCGVCGAWIPKGTLENPAHGCPFKVAHRRILEGI